MQSLEGSIEEDIPHLLSCNTYFDYVKTFFSKQDKRYMPDYGKCYLLVQLGYRSSQKVYTAEEFKIRKAEIEQWLHPMKEYPVNFSKALTKPEPILEELANRESPNMNKIISTIIYVHYYSKKSRKQLSGYIDYQQSLRRANLQQPGALNWHAIFSGRILLRPKPDDLSYINTSKNEVLYNDSENYSVVHSLKNGLSFRHRGDHKLVCVDISHPNCGQNSTRYMHFSEKYGFVIFYDHFIRKKI